ncbi:MAG TPA: oligosaccharide flippase family protein [Longimicrobiales bacterium]|nr:oligosaccharide flippase family protein [Longimicrobiales bacterium]
MTGGAGGAVPAGAPELQGRTLAGNTAWSILGQLPPLVLAAVAIPPLVHGLGEERFGVLGLVWVVLGVFGAFDLGMSRATTRAFAERRALGDEDGAEAVAWTSAAAQLGLGLVTGGVLAAGSGVLAGRLLAVPPSLAPEAAAAFALVGLAIPLVLVGNALRGVLEGGGRFDSVAWARGPLGSLTFLLPLLGMWAGLGLPGITALLAGGRALGVWVHLALCRRAWPGRFVTPRLAWGELRGLARFGAWVAVSSSIIPLLLYLDRFLLASLASLAAVAYYTVPYEGMTRILLVPAGVAAVIFPAFTSVAARGGGAALGQGLAGATRGVAVMMTPAVLIVVILADRILEVWLGAPFPEQSTMALRLLAGATFLHALGYAPLALLEGSGRPDVVARYHVLEFPVYATVAAFCIVRWGVTGAALAWLLRMAWMVPIFFVLCTRFAGLRPGSVLRGATGRALAAGGLALSLAAVAASLDVSLGAQILILGTLGSAWATAAWRWGFEAGDRALIRGYLSARKTHHA